MTQAVRWLFVGGLVAACLTGAVRPAAAQDPNTGALSLSGGVDVLNAYYFRGIPQDESGLITWPWADLGIALFEGGEGLESVSLNVGTWNSLHTGDAGLDGPADKLWYESDFYTTLGFGFAGGTSVGVTYTAYTSPNGLFGTVKELSFKLAVDDSAALGAAAMSPYVVLARELDGQADGGAAEGTYLELGVAPGYEWPRAGVTVPIKVGLSLADYYEGPGGDETFGYFSLAGVVTVPLTPAETSYGSWNVHGGVEYLRLGDRNQGLGENNVVVSAGIGFSY